MPGAVAATRAAWRGLRAALGAPLVARGPALRALLVEPPRPPGAEPGGCVGDADGAAALAARVALALVARLARLPAGPWRNTCLFRAVAECVALRSSGFPAVLRIGVAGDGGADPATAVTAHAWVECAGMACRTARGAEHAAYTVMRAQTRGAR